MLKIRRPNISGNTIKIIAMLSMLIDHAGLLLFNDNHIMRIIGRLAFPLFAFFIAEGCYYTKNKLRHFLEVFILAIVCQIVYFIQIGDWYLSILMTFSCSIILVYSVLLARKKKVFIFLPILLLFVAFFLCEIFPKYFPYSNFRFDYGFFGMISPMAVALFKNKWLKLLSFSIILIVLSYTFGGYQWYCLLSIIILIFYSGERGKLNIKYAFYIFYPLHLVILYAIQFLFA